MLCLEVQVASCLLLDISGSLVLRLILGRREYLITPAFRVGYNATLSKTNLQRFKRT